MNHPIPKPDQYQDMREALRDLCGSFDSAYWQKIDHDRDYPEAFVDAMANAGWLAALIPEQYGGSGLGLAEASVIMEEINFSGGNAGSCHGQMYNMGTLLRHGSETQKKLYLPKIATGELRLQTMAVTEPTTGTDTTKLKTTAVKKGDKYVVNGQKVWISRIQHSDLMILLARTTPLAEVTKKSEGMSIFIVDLKEAIGEAIPSMLPSLFTGGAAGIMARGATAAAMQAAEKTAAQEIARAAAKNILTAETIEGIKQAALKTGIEAAKRTALKYEATGALAGRAYPVVGNVGTHGLLRFVTM